MKQITMTITMTTDGEKSERERHWFLRKLKIELGRRSKLTKKYGENNEPWKISEKQLLDGLFVPDNDPDAPAADSLKTITGLSVVVEGIIKPEIEPDFRNNIENPSGISSSAWPPHYWIVDEKKLDEAYKKSEAKFGGEKTPRFVFNLPIGTKWEHIKIEFLNRDDVEVSINGIFFKRSNAKEMGFIRTGTRDEKNDRQWEFLSRLAAIYFSKSKSGELLIKPTIDNLKQFNETPEVIMKIKSKLADRLKGLYGITDDPFKKYDLSRGYETKFELVPEPELRRDGLWEVNTRKGYDESDESEMMDG
jgi:hypothetical protein